MISQVLIIFILFFSKKQVHCQDVIQDPTISWSFKSKSAEMKCSHKNLITHTQMYWYRQRPGETMTLIVYTAFGGQPDYGENLQSKYSAVKDSIEAGALTVKDLQPDDSGVYFCAVSKHSDVRKYNS
ncbi:PREDICTED: immunoglobulin iota chain-like [Poecilia mexicana]|uniref:immunoglobulin iota chain-like n=1 Tax=Poecilia mexicana TaxID=48701 RepID=UPI00072DF372|nr:PREDICTED: immunoglobulin iota chain-like [Poecilia mexicana]